MATGMAARVVYGLVGLSGLAYMILSFMGQLASFMSEMAMLAWVMNALLIIGALNWGIVSITGDRKKDLFEMVGQ